MPTGPYRLTEDQFYRLQRARHCIQVMSNLLGEDGADLRTQRKVSAVPDLTSDEIDALMRDVEQSYTPPDGCTRVYL